MNVTYTKIKVLFDWMLCISPYRTYFPSMLLKLAVYLAALCSGSQGDGTPTPAGGSIPTHGNVQ